MLAIFEVVKNIFSYDVSHLAVSFPSLDTLKTCPYTLSDFATMTGKERVSALREAKIDPVLLPLFIRAIQHLTAVYGSGSIEDSYRLHRHVSAHSWVGGYNCPLLGFPNVNSAAFRDSFIALPQKNDFSMNSVPAAGSQGESGRVNGLVNQGATCYLNSLLQSLFHLSEFRSIIYNMPTKEEADLSSNSSGVERMSNTISIPYALQRLFCRLQTGSRAADTTELTASFGWSASDGFVQHDVHELMHVLLNNLEAKISVQNGDGKKKEKNAINELFQGTLENYVRVEEANYYGSTEEPFYDLQLVVKNNKDIYTSFNAFFQTEVLDGKNKYCLERDGERSYHRAEKGVRLKKAPPILLLHLTRFDFNMQYGESKVFTKLAYYNTLDLSRYMPHLSSKETHYTLYSVLVHFGSNTGHGHYYCFLRCGGVWYKFNDEFVTPAKLKDVFGSNFGGFTMNYWGSEVAHMSNAYLLVYIRTSELHTLLRPLSETDLPAHVVQQLSLEEQERLKVEKELAEDYLYGRIKFLLPQEVVDHNELYYGRGANDLQIPSHRCARFHLEGDLFSECMEFLKQKKLCPEEELHTVMLWYPAPTGHTLRSGSAGGEAVESVSSQTSRFTAGEGHLRISGRIKEGMKVKDIVSGGESCMILFTTASTVPLVDFTSCDENKLLDLGGCSSTGVFSSADEEAACCLDTPEYQIFHHKLYDPIHLTVVSLGSTIVRRYPRSSIQPTLKCMESIIIELVRRLSLGEEEKELLNHDHKYDAERRRLEKSSFRRAKGERGNGSSSQDELPHPSAAPLSSGLKGGAPLHSLKGGTRTPSSMLLFEAAHTTASRVSMTPSASQAEDLDAYFGDFIAATPPTNNSVGVPFQAPSATIHPFPNHSESGLSSLSVHVEEDNNRYTFLKSWDEGGEGATEDSSGSARLNGTHQKRRRQREFLFSGDIFVWQTPVKRDDPNIFFYDIVAFQQFLQSQVTVTIRLNRPPECPPLIKTTLSEVMTYEQLQRYVARLIGEKDFDRIRFTRHNPETEQPYFMKGTKADLLTLHQLLALSVHRIPTSATCVYYERCKYPVSKVEKTHSLQFQVFSEAVKPVSSHWILIPLEEPITKVSFFKTVVEEVAKDLRRALSSERASRRGTAAFEEEEEDEEEYYSGEEAGALHHPKPRKEGTEVSSRNNATEPMELSVSNTLYSPTLVETNTRMPILDFILHHCRPEDAWQHFRLVDVWRGRIYSVFDADHPLRFSSRNTFEESALYRIEYLPLPLPLAPSANDRSPSVVPSWSPVNSGESSGAATYGNHASGQGGSSPTGRRYPNQTLINVYHFSHTRQRRDLVETHSDPFSLFISHDEKAAQLLPRIAGKLEVPLLTLQDWKLSLVKEKRVVAVEPDVPLIQQWVNFCESCSPANGGGSPCSMNVCDTNIREPMKVPFFGLEHARPNTVRGSKQEKVVIRN